MDSLLLAIVLSLQAPVITSGNGTITGRILSTDGVPAAGVRVTAMTPKESGQAEGISVHSSITQTDSSGRFRLENVPPGRYYITAGLIDAPTYYAGVSALSAATVVVIAEGATKEGVDFQLKVPTGMKVSGRLAVLPTPRATPATLTLGGRETNVNPDGTFEFQRVTPGRYTLTNYLGLPNLPVQVTDHDVTGLEIGRGAAGVRVNGRIVSPGSSPGMFTPVRILLSGNGATTLQVRPDAAGAFEFLQVPPGSYRILVSVPGSAQPVSLVVADKDITNLEILIPFQSEISGRVVLEDGRPWPSVAGASIEARRANGTSGSGIEAGGSFTVRVSEGEYQIGLRGLPLGYALKGVSIDGNPVAGLIKVAPGVPAPANVVVTLASLPLESIQGVKVSGQITGVSPGGLTGATVIVSGDPGPLTIQTTPNPDGTFEFPKVPAGNYSARVNGVANASLTLGPRFSVGTDNVAGIQIPVDVRTSVTGRATAVDASGNVVPGFPTGVSVWFYRGRFGYGNVRPDGTFGSAMTTARPDGTFSLSLTEGEYVIGFERLPPGYTIKSITSGSIDLVKTHLTVEKDVMPPLIQVQIEAKP